MPTSIFLWTTLAAALIPCPPCSTGSVVRRVYGEPIVHTNVYPPSCIEHTSAAAVVVDPTNQAVVPTKGLAVLKIFNNDNM